MLNIDKNNSIISTNVKKTKNKKNKKQNKTKQKNKTKKNNKNKNKNKNKTKQNKTRKQQSPWTFAQKMDINEFTIPVIIANYL